MMMMMVMMTMMRRALCSRNDHSHAGTLRKQHSFDTDLDEVCRTEHVHTNSSTLLLNKAGDTGDAATTPFCRWRTERAAPPHCTDLNPPRAKTAGELSEVSSHDFTLSPTKQRTVVSQQGLVHPTRRRIRSSPLCSLGKDASVGMMMMRRASCQTPVSRNDHSHAGSNLVLRRYSVQKTC